MKKKLFLGFIVLLVVAFITVPVIAATTSTAVASSSKPFDWKSMCAKTNPDLSWLPSCDLLKMTNAETTARQAADTALGQQITTATTKEQADNQQMKIFFDVLVQGDMMSIKDEMDTRIAQEDQKLTSAEQEIQKIKSEQDAAKNEMGTMTTQIAVIEAQVGGQAGCYSKFANGVATDGGILMPVEGFVPADCFTIIQPTSIPGGITNGCTFATTPSRVGVVITAKCDSSPLDVTYLMVCQRCSIT